MIKPTEHTIDATGKSLGRIASQAAKTLMGKTSPDYTPNKPSPVKVTIVNVGKLNTTEKKRTQKRYTSYTGYPGGFKVERLEQLNARKGEGEALRRAIERMLPRNTLRVIRMKNLTITV